VNEGIAPQPGRIDVSAGALVVLIGAAASGKSTFAAAHFVAESVVSSDGLRSEMSAPPPDDIVFAAVHRQVQARLAAGLMAVVDATNTDWMWRATLIDDARRYGRPAIAIVFNLPLDVCLARNAARSRKVPVPVIRRQVADVTRDIERLDLEGFAAVHVLRSSVDVAAVRVEIEKGPVTRALTS
jgi:predicted kinase